MSDKTRLARYFYLSFLWTAAKRLETFGHACRDALSLAKTVNLDWWELWKVQIFAAFLHSVNGSDRKSATWWNVLELKSSTSAWRGDGKWGACQDILEASCLDTMRLSGQEKGRCDFKQDFHTCGRAAGFSCVLLSSLDLWLYCLFLHF